jgi:hypothetical protein
VLRQQQNGLRGLYMTSLLLKGHSEWLAVLVLSRAEKTVIGDFFKSTLQWNESCDKLEARARHGAFSAQCFFALKPQTVVFVV